MKGMVEHAERMMEHSRYLVKGVENVYLQICGMSCQQKGRQLEHGWPFPCNGLRRSSVHVDSIEKQSMSLYRRAGETIMYEVHKLNAMQRNIFFLPAISKVYIS